MDFGIAGAVGAASITAWVAMDRGGANVAVLKEYWVNLESFWPRGTMWLVAALYFGLGVLVAFGEDVVVYIAHDEIYSAPILKSFEAKTGIRVKSVFDVEVSKTTGLVNRLIAESRHARADVFWNNEVAQTIVLKNRDVLEKYRSPEAESIPDRYKDADGYWAGFGARARVIIYNTDLVEHPPTSIFDLTSERWRDQVGIALPLFGTTATHAAALFAELGEQEAADFFRALKANGVNILDGNSTVRDFVARGRLQVGLTDTDDANAAVLDGRPTKWLFPDQGPGQIGTLAIPNTVCLIRGAPHRGAGTKLIDFLLSTEVEEHLAKGRAMQMPVRAGVPVPRDLPRLEGVKTMTVDFDSIADHMASVARFIQNEFVR